MALAAIALVACKPGGNNSDEPREELPDWYYTGGTLGTTTNTSSMAFRQPTPATEAAGMGALFAQGDQIAEKEFVTNESGRQHGLGPVYVRSSCQHCHPNYSHGTSVPEGTYNASKIGNGTLLVVIDPETQNYVTWLAGMPQLFGAAPFKAPLDPNQITVTWKTAVDEHGERYPYRLVPHNTSLGTRTAQESNRRCIRSPYARHPCTERDRGHHVARL